MIILACVNKACFIFLQAMGKAAESTALSMVREVVFGVGFAILLKFMMTREMWGFYFMGFGLALVVANIPALATPALLILAFIGFGIAFWDFQQQTELKGAVATTDGGEEDGI